MHHQSTSAILELESAQSAPDHWTVPSHSRPGYLHSLTDGEREILAELNADAAEDSDPIVCPRCGSSRVAVEVLMGHAVNWQPQLECSCWECGHLWDED